MTGFVDQEEDFGQEQEESARALFARTAAEHRPQLGFTAEDMALDGRRRVRRRRVVAMMGSTASVAAVAVAATAFAGGAGSGAPVTSAVAPSPQPTAHTTAPTTVSSTAAKPLTDDERTTVEKNLAGAVFAEVIGELDPGTKHIALPHPPHGGSPYTPNSGQCVEKTKVQTGYGLSVEWTADGKAAFPRAQDDTSPYVQIMVSVFAPGQGADQFGDVGAWGPITRSQLSDGSTLATASAAQGHRLQAVRTTTSHQQIVLTVTDGWANGGGSWGPQDRKTDPFPFTVAQLGGIVRGLSLPLPFSDGYQPHTKCGAF